jgi:trk system potassium uptake protein TrkH
MNYRLVSKLLGMVAALTGVTMVFSLPWAIPALGHRTGEQASGFEKLGFLALLASMIISFVVAGILYWIGRRADRHIYRKEAMAVVGLSWVLATVLGALPFWFCGASLCPSVRLFEADHRPLVFGEVKLQLSDAEYLAVRALLNCDHPARGLTAGKLRKASREAAEAEQFEQLAGSDPEGQLEQLANSDPDWRRALIFPGQGDGPADRVDRYRIRSVRMTFVDCLFESQSGFSTTGATVIADLEDPVLIPHCVLYWRSSTHFLGGLGIIVLFVVVLGQGSAGKALMRAEMPGPSKEGSQARMQHTAWTFAFIYCGLNAILAILLKLCGMSWFDATCHAYGTMATGGFSTFNASVGHFDSAAIDYTIVVFMALAGTNFTLLYLLCLLRPRKILADVEWRTYMTIIAIVTLLVVLIGLSYGDFLPRDGDGQAVALPWHQELARGVRFGLFQVVSIITTTGYSTADFDVWNSFGRAVLFTIMFVGGCAGSTGGGLKVIRHVLFFKILWLEIEKSYHPSVVRPLRIGGQPVDDPDLRKNILVYFGIILFFFINSWLFIVTIEPDLTWGTEPAHVEHKLIDSASVVNATLNNIGPGLGIIGSTKNYAHFTPVTKILLIVLMMIGRLEIFAIVVLFVPGFWRAR